MKLDFSKITSRFSFGRIKSLILGFFGSSPRKYWPWFLFFFVALSLTSITFIIFLFLSLSSTRPVDTVDLEKVEEIKINLSGMNEAIKVLDERKKDFDEAISEPLFLDPSI